MDRAGYSESSNTSYAGRLDQLIRSAPNQPPSDATPALEAPQPVPNRNRNQDDDDSEPDEDDPGTLKDAPDQAKSAVARARFELGTPRFSETGNWCRKRQKSPANRRVADRGCSASIPVDCHSCTRLKDVAGGPRPFRLLRSTAAWGSKASVAPRPAQAGLPRRGCRTTPPGGLTRAVLRSGSKSHMSSLARGAPCAVLAPPAPSATVAARAARGFADGFVRQPPSQATASGWRSRHSLSAEGSALACEQEQPQ